MLNINGAVAVITGGGSGIGEAVAKYWVQNGGRVVLGDIASEGLFRVERLSTPMSIPRQSILYPIMMVEHGQTRPMAWGRVSSSSS